MANQSSQIITDLDAKPLVKVNTQEISGQLRIAQATLAMTTGAVADVKRFVRLPSRAVVLKVELANDDLDSNGAPTLASDMGLYRTAEDGGAVQNAAFFASAITQLQAAANFTDVTYESGVVTVADRCKALWEQLGLTADPEVEYDVAATYTAGAATHANGNATLRVTYVLPE